MGRTVGVQGVLFENLSPYLGPKHNPYTRLWNAETGETYYEHRCVAEEKLGRNLQPGEVVHHADGDKRNNDPSNIMVFSSQRAHMLYEHYLEREAQGVQHVFRIEDVLEFRGEWMLE